MGRLNLGVAVAGSLVVVAGSLGVVTAAKPPQTVAATVAFRCMTDNPGSPGPCDPLDQGGTERVRDDGAVYTGAIDQSGLFSPQIATPANGRLVNLHFGASLTRNCLTVGNCHPNGATDGKHLVLDSFQFRVKPLVDGTWEDLPGLLFGMSACNTRYPALSHFTYWLPDGNGHWGFNFNPRAYAGTTAAVVVRLDNLTWTVEAEAEDIGELLSWGHTRIFRRNGPSLEGKFNMPFKATIAVSSLPAGAGTCN